MEDLLTYFYTAKIRITPENAHSICITADYLDIPPLLAVSENFLRQNLSTENVLELFLMADKLQLEELRRNCVHYLWENYEPLMKDTKLHNFTAEDLLSIMKEMNRIVTTGRMKESMFEMVINWVEIDPNPRLASFESLLQSIPLNELNHRFLKETVETEKIFMNHNDRTAHNGKIYVHSKDGFEVYSPAADVWQKLTSLKDNIVNRTLVSAGDRLLALGGNKQGQTEALKSTFSYDFSTGQWLRLPDMQTRRKNFKAFAVEVPSILKTSSLFCAHLYDFFYSFSIFFSYGPIN